MKQTPIFIPLSSIESIGEAETTPYRCGLMEIVTNEEQLQGFCCGCLTAEYYWQSNGSSYTSIGRYICPTDSTPASRNTRTTTWQAYG